MKKTHELKTWTEFFQEVKSGCKNFELRKNDRNYQKGDILVLKEYLPNLQKYTGDEITVEVTYLLNSDNGCGLGLIGDHCIMGIKLLTPPTP